MDNLDRDEIARYNRTADQWWQRNGRFQALHDINDLRLAYVRQRVRLDGCRVLDAGCGGGILAEALARNGARVTGIDMAAAQLAAARGHMQLSGLAIDYRQTRIEAMAQEDPAAFDLVTIMELLEHVPDPAAVIRAARRLVRPGGAIFISTLNRTPLSLLLAILAAEYLLGIVPKGTHCYRRLVKPAELCAWAAAAGLECRPVQGFRYLPVIRATSFCDSPAVNYLAHLARPSFHRALPSGNQSMT